MFGGGSFLALGAGGDHAGLEENALEENVVLGQVEEGFSPDLLGDLKGAVDAVLAVEEDLGLDDGDEAVILGDGRVAGQAPGCFFHGQGGWAVGDAHHRAPGFDGGDGQRGAEGFRGEKKKEEDSGGMMMKKINLIKREKKR